MRYIELCAGVGGTRAGLDAAGWECRFAGDYDPDVVAVHRAAFGSIELVNVADIDVGMVPECDVWVAGFPCQPFSTSGHMTGFEHKSGNVFENIMRLAAIRRPALLLFENVLGLLSNKSGHTFTCVLERLNALDYEADWMVIDAAWLGVPQSRPRVFLLASQPSRLARRPADNHAQRGLFENVGFDTVFAPMIERLGLALEFHGRGSLSMLRHKLAPAIGKPNPRGPTAYAGLGRAIGGEFVSYRTKAGPVAPVSQLLGEIVAPEFRSPEAIRPVRFYSENHGGVVEGVHVRNMALSYCVGTSLGGAPLFSVPLASVAGLEQRGAFLSLADWHVERRGLLVMRLNPARTARLFGEHTAKIECALMEWTAGSTRKFKLVGNMVAPIVASTLAGLVMGSFRREEG